MSKQKIKHNHTNKKEEKTTSAQATTSVKPSFIDEDKLSLILLFILILVVWVLRTKFLNIPFERDEGAYSYYGKLLAEGKIPYKDFYEMKFPGIFYLYAFVVSVFGDTVKAMHVGFMIINMLTIIVVFYASKLLFNSIAGLIAAITFAFLSFNPSLSGFTVQSEHGVAFFISLGILFYALSKKYNVWYWYLLMGLAMGYALMIKTNAVFLCVWGAIILLADFVLTAQKNYKIFFKNAGLYTLGGLSVVGVFFLIIITKGSFEDMMFWTITVPKMYVSNVTLEQGMEFFNNTKNAVYENYKLFWIHSLLALLLCWYKGIDLKIKVFGISLLLFSFFTVVPGFYFYGHYFIQLLPGFSVVAGLTAFCILTIFKDYFKEKNSWLKWAYVSVFIIMTYTHVTSLKGYYLKPNYDQILRAVYGINPFPEAMEIAKFINANTTPEDNIAMIGSEPEIFFYTKKKSPSRHAYFSAMVNSFEECKAWQREFTADIEKNKPKYFVFFNHAISLLVQPNSDKHVFDWANQYITNNYKLVGLIDMTGNVRSIYKWKEEALTYKPVSQYIIYIFERKL